MQTSYNDILKLYRTEDLAAYGLTLDDAKEAMQRISYQHNDLFRYVFASGDEKSKTILKHLTSLIIRRPVVDVTIHNSELIKSSLHVKGSRLDVLVRITDEQGQLSDLNLEIQNYGTALQNSIRSQVYLAKIITDQVVQGNHDYYFNKTYQVMFCNTMDLFKSDAEYYHEFHFLDIHRFKELPDNRSVIIFFELEKLKKLETIPVESWSELEKFGYILKFGNDPEKHDILSVLEKDVEVLELMKEKREDYFKDTVQALSSMREYFDKQQEILEKEYIYNEGKTEGKAEIILQLLKSHTIEQVSDITQISTDEINELLSNFI